MTASDDLVLAVSTLDGLAEFAAENTRRLEQGAGEDAARQALQAIEDQCREVLAALHTRGSVRA